MSLFTNRPRPKEVASFNQALCRAVRGRLRRAARTAGRRRSPTAPVVRRESRLGGAAAAPARRPRAEHARRACARSSSRRSSRCRPPRPRAGRAVRPQRGPAGLDRHQRHRPRPARRRQAGHGPEERRAHPGRRAVHRPGPAAPPRGDGAPSASRSSSRRRTAAGTSRRSTTRRTSSSSPGRAGLVRPQRRVRRAREAGRGARLTTQLAMAAGLDALREAGIPLVQTWKKTTTGKYLPERWMLPEAMRDETGVIFASAFPGYNRFADEAHRYYTFESRRAQKRQLEELLETTREPGTPRRRSRGGSPRSTRSSRRSPTRSTGASCSASSRWATASSPSTSAPAGPTPTSTRPAPRRRPAIALAEDWIRSGRCRRVVVVAADNVTSDAPDRVDRRRASSRAGPRRPTSASRRPRCRSTAAATGRSSAWAPAPSWSRARTRSRSAACAGSWSCSPPRPATAPSTRTRLDVEHVASVVESLVASAERRFGVDRDGDGPEDGVRLARDLHAGARRQRRRRDHGAARRSSATPPNRDHRREHQGLHRPPDGRRDRGRDRRQDPRARDRAAGAQPQGARPRPRAT